MAAQGITISLSIKDDGTPVISKISGNLKNLKKETEDGAKGMSGALATVKENWLGISAAVYGAERALAKAWEMAKKGAEFEESTARLNTQLESFGMNAGELVPKLQDLVGGQLSVAEATTLASKALAAGITPEHIKTMTRMSEIMGDIKGTDVATAFEELNSALVTGRDKALKAVGIIVDLDKEVEKVAKSYKIEASAISDAEKAQIRLNAVMMAAPDFLKKFETASLSHADQLSAMEKKYADLELAVSRWAKTAVLAIADVIKARAGLVMMATGQGGGKAPLTLEQKVAGAHAAATGGGGGAMTPVAKATGISAETRASLEKKSAEASTKVWVEHALAQEEMDRDRLDHDIEISDKRTKTLVESLMDQDEAVRASGERQIALQDAAVSAFGRVQQDKGRKIVEETTAEVAFWDNQMKAMSDASSFAFGQIQAQFASSMANMIVHGGNLKDFMSQIAVTILSTMIQMMTATAVAWVAKDATIVASTAATAGATVSIWAGASAAIVGFYASVAAGFTAITATMISILTAVGTFVMGVLSAIAGALTATVFGIPWAGAILVGVAAIGVAIAAGTGVIKMADGGSGVVTKPTLFLAGEAGPESFNFTPLGKGGSGNGGHGGGGEEHFHFYLDGRELTSRVIRKMPGELRMAMGDG
jgi:hypothetical protein